VPDEEKVHRAASVGSSGVEVLSSRLHVSASDFDRSREFYEQTLGLRVYREYGVAGRVTGVVFFCGGGFLELGARDDANAEPTAAEVVPEVFLWLQVPSLNDEHARLVGAGVDIDVPPRRMPWGLVEMWIRDPDGLRLVLVEVPTTHPLRRRVD
jgi:catechol 2,3-dioxygenase-like lactoylglutathione lyase family enzyme